jgi:hypothetical protein
MGDDMDAELAQPPPSTSGTGAMGGFAMASGKALVVSDAGMQRALALMQEGGGAEATDADAQRIHAAAAGRQQLVRSPYPDTAGASHPPPPTLGSAAALGQAPPPEELVFHTPAPRRRPGAFPGRNASRSLGENAAGSLGGAKRPAG